MKKLYFLLILLLTGIAQNSNAQNTCSTAIQLTSGAAYTDSLVTGNVPNTDTSNNYGCLTTTQNVTWLYFHACTNGSITLTLTGNGASPGSGLDVDFVAWGPLASPSTCGLSSSQIVDCNYGTSSVKTIHIPTGAGAQDYKIMISNFSNLPGTYTITQTGGPGTICPSGGCPAPPVQQICKVSTDQVANKNVIIWNKDVSFTGTYSIQKETTTMGVYATIGTIPSTDSSAYVDSVSNPTIQSFKYRIVTADTCGDTLTGASHTTIHLLVSANIFTGDAQLSWNPYVGFSYSTYYIYRGASPSTISLYDSISASFTTYTDAASSPAATYYAVVVAPPAPCHPSRALMQEFCFSNVTTALTTGIAENSFSDLVISPNPATNELSFATENNHYSSINFEIYDITGRKLISNLYENTSSAKIDVSNLSNGYYVVRFITDKGATQRNIIIAK